jgi:hypothetical protein
MRAFARKTRKKPRALDRVCTRHGGCTGVHAKGIFVMRSASLLCLASAALTALSLTLSGCAGDTAASPDDTGSSDEQTSALFGSSKPKAADLQRLQHCKDEAQRVGVPRHEIAAPDITTKTLDDGRLRITVKHAPLQHLSFEQMEWWLAHMGSAFPRDARGKQLSDCQPYVLLDDDHVTIEQSNVGPEGRLSVDSRLHFKEILTVERTGKPLVMDEDVRITKLDPSAEQFVKDKLFGVTLPLTLVTVDRTYEAVGDDLQLVTVLTAGIENRHISTFFDAEARITNDRPELGAVVKEFFSGLKGLAIRELNSLLLKKMFDDDVQSAWKHHTTEEYGALDTYIPWVKAHWMR